MSILKRKPSGPGHSSEVIKKRRKTGAAGASNPNVPPTHPSKRRSTHFPTSPLHRSAVNAIARLLDADASGRDGVSLKSLTLAPHIENKRAVYAVTVETLKHVPVREKLVRAAPQLGVPDVMAPAVAYVLIRDLLWGEGVHATGPAERAVLESEPQLRKALQKLLKEAGESEVAALLPATKLAALAARRPRTARVNELKMSVEQALEWLREPPVPHKTQWKSVVSLSRMN